MRATDHSLNYACWLDGWTAAQPSGGAGGIMVRHRPSVSTDSNWCLSDPPQQMGRAGWILELSPRSNSSLARSYTGLQSTGPETRMCARFPVAHSE
jgi:hypothetical protein